jgi:hypothetical protein
MRILFVAAALSTVFIAGAAAAQNPSAAAAFGATSARSGFTPDPLTISLASGGPVDATRLGGACVGMIGAAPDYEFTYTAGSYPLSFQVQSQGDTSLVINGPDGRWYCVDDSSGLNPILTWNRPSSGSYDVWVGAVGQAAPATLYITETP